MKDYSFYNRAIILDKKNAGIYYKERAILYFYDMEYDKAFADFEQAKILGVDVESVCFYQFLKRAKEKNIPDFDDAGSSEYYSKYSVKVGYYLVQHKYSELFELLGHVLSKSPDFDKAYREMLECCFDAKRYKYKCIIEKKPKYQSVYFWRIKLYSENLSRFHGLEKRFYRQRINQDFETLEKISKNPEYICFFRAKYYENLHEFRYAIKYCKKSLAFAKNKSDEGFVYIVLSLLKDLYVKNYDIDSAYEVALEMVKTKPSPQLLSKAVNNFFYIPSLFNFDFSSEFNKYKSFRFIKESLRKKYKNSHNIGKKNEKNNC